MLYCLESIKVNKRGFNKCNFCYKLFCSGGVESFNLRNNPKESKSERVISLPICLLGVFLERITSGRFEILVPVGVHGLLNAHETVVVSNSFHEL